MNDKFLTGTGRYGIDFNQINRVERGYKDGVHLVLLFTKKEKYPIITLICESERQALKLHRNISICIEGMRDYEKVIKLADFRKD